MINILTNAPVWVWPLLAVLIFTGLRARQTRQVPVVLIYLLPLLAIMPLRAASALGAPVWIWGIFALAFVMGATLGLRAQRGWLLGYAQGRVHIAGEPWTLVVLMIIFWANFAGGFLSAVAPQIYTAAAFQILFVAVIAAGSGSFAGRALCTLVFVRGGNHQPEG